MADPVEVAGPIAKEGSGRGLSAGERLAGDLLMGEFVAATSLNEEVGEVVDDVGRLGELLRQHGSRQIAVGQRFLSDLASARTVPQLLSAHLHAGRTTADNQLALLVDAARLQADAIARTRHMLAIGFAALERAVSGKPAAQDHPPRH